MLLLALVVVVLGGKCWARTLQQEDSGGKSWVLQEDSSVGKSWNKQEESLASVGNQVQKDIEVNESGCGLDNTVNCNITGDFNGLIEQKSVLDDAVRGVETWLQEYIEDDEQGRHFKRKRMMLQMMMWLKTLGLGVVLPVAVAIALFTAWKGITISLLALMLAGIVGIKGLVASATSKTSSGQPQHVILSGVPSHHEHYWQRRSELPQDTSSWSGGSSHQLVYRAYTS